MKRCASLRYVFQAGSRSFAWAWVSGRPSRAIARRPRRLLELARRADQFVELFEVRLGREPPLLGVLLRHRSHQLPHRDLAVLIGGTERCRQRAVANRAAGELELRSEEVEVDVVG